MWNFSYTIPTFLILIIFLTYYLVRPKMETKVNRTFLWLLLVDAAAMFFDYIATRMDENFQTMDVTALYLINMLFFVLFVLRSFLFYLFTVDVLNLRKKKLQGFEIASLTVLVLTEVGVILSYWTHLVFWIDGSGYHSGIIYQIINLQFAFFMLVALLLLVREGKRLTKLAYNSLFITDLILLIGVITRTLMSRILLMNLFCLLAVVILFLAFQNPDKNIDRRTGLFNRYAFEETVNEMLTSRFHREMVGFVIKNYEDTRTLYGRIQMDAGLASIAAYLKSEFEDAHLYYLRNGEFVIGVEEGTNLDDIRLKLEERFLNSWRGKNSNLYLQVGFIQEKIHDRFESVEQFMDCLEATFHLAGRIGRHGVIEINNERKVEREHYLSVKRAIENAIKRDAVEIYLMPIAEAGTAKVVGAEALARIDDPELGLLMPGEFIGLAEENGSIIILGEQIFRKTCEFMADQGVAMGLKWINVNLSPIQCMDLALADEFTEIINEFHLDPKFIHLEITEH